MGFGTHLDDFRHGLCLRELYGPKLHQVKQLCQCALQDFASIVPFSGSRGAASSIQQLFRLKLQRFILGGLYIWSHKDLN